MDKSDVLDLLPEYARGKLGNSEARRVSTLLDTDPELRGEYDKIQRYYAALASLEPVEVPQDFLDQVKLRTQRGSLLSRTIATLLFPLHIKLPIEALGLVAVSILVIAIFNPLSVRTTSILQENTAVSAIDVPTGAAVQEDVDKSDELMKPERQRSADLKTVPSETSPPPQAPVATRAKAKALSKESAKSEPSKRREPLAPATIDNFAADDNRSGGAAETPAAAAAPQATMAATRAAKSPEPIELNWTLRLSGNAAAPAAMPRSSVSENSKRTERKAARAESAPAPSGSEYSMEMPERDPGVQWVEQLATESGASLVVLTDSNTPNQSVYTITITAARLTVLRDMLAGRGLLDASGIPAGLQDPRQFTVKLVVSNSP